MADKRVSLEVDIQIEGAESIEQLEQKLKDIEKELATATKGSDKFYDSQKKWREVSGRLDTIKKSAGGTATAFNKVKDSSDVLKGGIEGASSSMKTFAMGSDDAKELITELSSNLIGATAIWGVVAIGIVKAGAAIYEYATRLTQAEKQQEKFAEITKETTDSMAEQVVQFDVLFARLNATNGASDERLAIINEINETYGTTIKNLKDEAKFAEQVAMAYDKVAQSLELKIKLQVSMEELSELQREENELNRDLEESQKRVTEAERVYNKAKKEGTKSSMGRINAQSEEDLSLKKLNLTKNKANDISIKIAGIDSARQKILNKIIESQRQLDSLKLKSVSIDKKVSEDEKSKAEKDLKTTQEKTILQDAPGAFTFDSSAYQKAQDQILSIRKSFREKLEDEEAKTEEEKITLEEERVIAELDRLKATSEQRLEVQRFYEMKRKTLEIKNAEEIAEAKKSINEDLINTSIQLLQEGFNTETELGKAAFNAGKALSVAKAGIDTYAAANAALKTGSEINPTYGLISAGIAIATGLLNVKKILSTQIGSTNTNMSAPNGNVGTPQGQLQQPRNINLTEQGRQRVQIDPLRVFVLESDITNAQLDVNATKQVSVIK